MQESDSPDNPKRRDFVKKAAALTLGTVTAAVPVFAGVRVLMDPLARKAVVGEPVRVTTLEALPKDGTPRKFSIIANRTDAWNKYPSAAIGAIYLRRTSENTVEALNVVCPHAGCFVDYMPARNRFFCPCHNSSFALDGAIADAKSPSPRPLDTLEVQIRDGNEVWVKFQNFKAGHAEKLPVV